MNDAATPGTIATGKPKLRTAAGGYAMLALDQRESLRAMFGQRADGSWVDDDELRRFKRQATEVLAPHASAVLLDRPYAIDGHRPDWVSDAYGLIVAADALDQQTGGPVRNTTFDEQVTVEFLHRVRADAIKFLVIWRPGTGKEERADVVARTVEVARDAGVASLVEAIVATDDGSPWPSEAERHQAIFAAAEEIAPYRPDLYKAQVPGYVPGDLSRVADQARTITEIVGTDWVVLSNGIAREDFADAVRESVRGGAKGFLAGRAVWADLVGSADTPSMLAQISIPRLQQLTGIVDAAQA
ncbi:hypothetical protein [Phytoactinopolyspora halotolerans]|uniref:Aldolase n=1 Tax=Phytoactinopolyspora halotolerans TaxID=1981512 RepID=A0A6L9SHP1_9ACTN|nr:hypothetical protein [Phytoactinopolyspora halotolerans]NEE03831.1 hypothetical protein [Phytoactinopolyspora halotolerans]